MPYAKPWERSNGRGLAALAIKGQLKVLWARLISQRCLFLALRDSSCTESYKSKNLILFRELMQPAHGTARNNAFFRVFKREIFFFYLEQKSWFFKFYESIFSSPKRRNCTCTWTSFYFHRFYPTFSQRVRDFIRKVSHCKENTQNRIFCTNSQHFSSYRLNR